MSKSFRILGSLKIAVSLLVTLAGVLAWGTIYEARFGTASVQRFVYHSGWFQCLLAFLAVNLGAAAMRRYPWKRKHLPFVLAHIGIILILTGGIVGARLGKDGQMIIREGESSDSLQTDRNVLAVRQPDTGLFLEFETRFDTTAWNHAPHALFEVPLEGKPIQMVVDRYFPNSEEQEGIRGDGKQENPAIRLTLSQEGQEEPPEELWLLARDPDRFGARWGSAHVLFLEPRSEEELRQLLGGKRPSLDRGVVAIELPERGIRREIPVPQRMNRPRAIPGTPYTITFKDYFTDFALSDQGPVNRSDRPDNPAVAFLLTGPEGTDPHLLFALHPEFARIHGIRQKIPVRLSYTRASEAALPPDAIALLKLPSGHLAAVFTDSKGGKKEVDPLTIGQAYTHPTLGIRFTVDTFFPRAVAERFYTNRDDEIRSEAIHLTARRGRRTAAAWLDLRGSAELPLGGHPLTVEYRPAVQPVPFSVKLLDFRKTDYPGTEMAAGFESDVELTDAERGVTLKRKITMNNPLKYRGYSLFQSSYVEGPVETTVLSVRKDPGTPLVYAGFLIVLAGVISLFTSRSRSS